MGYDPLTHIVVIGGIDPSGGAGLIRDALTAEALGCTATFVGSAWTLQGPDGFASLEPRSTAAFGVALRHALDQVRHPGALKIGVIATPALAAAAAAILAERPDLPVVFDPVLRSSAGGQMFCGTDAGLAADLAPLLERTDLLTPNLAESVSLGGSSGSAAAILALGPKNVLVKGGHLEGPAVDRLDGVVGHHRFESPRFHPTHPQGPRGTGCALATAIAIGLARGLLLPEAISGAKSWLSGRIQAARPVGAELRL